MIKKIIILSVIVAIILITSKFEKPEKKTIKKFGAMEEPKYFFKIEKTGNLISDFIKFVQLKEGGLSDDLSDSASKYPSPYKNAKTGRFYHTNKGITYKTFEDLAPKLGYKVTESNFLKIPQEIWFKIFHNGYYKPFDGLTKSDLINLYVSLWAWGSGIGGANALIKKIGEDLQKYLNVHGEKETLQFLVNQRIKFYERLAEQKPQNAKFLQGWKNAALSFYKNFEGYAKT